MKGTEHIYIYIYMLVYIHVRVYIRGRARSRWNMTKSNAGRTGGEIKSENY